ncbi:MAG TPA: potassium-transporting ATPase subunit KdpC [Candidatus Binataceae bacterium]|nr:potassium-transporting ATPase subunit KdpC [Candidatus Binataceae bacterium]
MTFWTALRMTLVLTVLTGIVYPLAMAGLANLLFPFQAQGSLISRGGRVVGSALIGQNFSSPRYFHGRPSAAGDKGYDASDSGGSNLGPTNRVLIASVGRRLKKIVERNPAITAAQVPVDMVTASGSGLDPEISPAAADLQVPAVAKARGLGEDQLRELVRSHTRPRWGGVLGEPGVNVLELNLALDDLSGQRRVSLSGQRLVSMRSAP